MIWNSQNQYKSSIIECKYHKKGSLEDITGNSSKQRRSRRGKGFRIAEGNINGPSIMKNYTFNAAMEFIKTKEAEKLTVTDEVKDSSEGWMPAAKWITEVARDFRIWHLGLGIQMQNVNWKGHFRDERTHRVNELRRRQWWATKCDDGGCLAEKTSVQQFSREGQKA
ncbi:uncharacterized protein G2W53_000520 [Senna tora]|uniref:Uncharacterized protein n=1 Tax=Senna tora TaxID=362788 RepID=A0A835CKN0_9FABA|nr:uncharacterized protein G2W53_000520 [Senna tora]